MIITDAAADGVLSTSCTHTSYTNVPSYLMSEASGRQAFGWSIGGSSRALSVTTPLTSISANVRITSWTVSAAPALPCWFRAW